MTIHALRTRRMLIVLATLSLTVGACGGPVADDGDVAATAADSGQGDQGEPTASEAASPDTASEAAPVVPTVTPAPASTPSPTPTPTPSPTPTPKPLVQPDLPTGIVDPVRIEIPSIGVDASLVDLSLGNGDPEVPEAWEDAGWYSTTRNPGEIGPAVIAGHIDSKAGPAVFYRLDDLAPGDEVIVHGADGATRAFVVEDSGQYPKTGLPDEVFGFGQARPELRLITCGGSFDRGVGHYVDNLVVYARGV